MKEFFESSAFSIILSVFLFVIGAYISFLITRWSMNRSKKDDLLGASKEILGTANQIIETLHIVREISKDTKYLTSEESKNTVEKTKPNDDYVDSDTQLLLRLSQKKEEKTAVGKHISKFITNDSCIAIDCGTSAAWAYHEIAKTYKSSLKVLTNNIFIPSMFAQEYDYSLGADYWGVKEEPSLCYLTSGYYYPSYGGILMTNDDSEKYYDDLLTINKPDIIIMGCTSFTSTEGPFARSGANRRFKSALMRYFLNNKAARLFIVLDILKIGKRIGEACNSELWEGIKDRNNISITAGFSGTRKDFDNISYEMKAVISEEVRIMNQKTRQNQFLVVDLQGDEINLKKYFKET